MLIKKSGFVALDIARLVVSQLGPIVRALKQHDRDLARQLQRASSSVLLNIEEGRKRVAGDQRRSFEMACGSASEVRAAVELAALWGWVARDAQLDVDMDRLVALLRGASRPKAPKGARASPAHRDARLVNEPSPP